MGSFSLFMMDQNGREGKGGMVGWLVGWSGVFFGWTPSLWKRESHSHSYSQSAKKREMDKKTTKSRTTKN